MRKNNTPEYTIRIKMGLIFLVVILYFCGVFIYSYTLKKGIDAREKEIARSYQILSQTNHLISSIQQVQNITNAYLSSPDPIFEQQYDSLSAEITKQIVEMQNISLSKSQNTLLRNIHALLGEKNTLVSQLAKQFKRQNPLKELDRKIENIMDSSVVATNQSTTIVVKEKKDFWSRLKNLFKPQSAVDTTISITTTEKDTLKSGVDKTTYADLKKTTQQASQNYSHQLQGIEKQVKEIIFSEQEISLQLSQLLTQLHQETIETARNGISESSRLTQRIFIFSVASGVISLLLILTFILLIANDLNKGQKARIDLIKEKQLTEKLMKSRHQLLLSVSHDIKTPLTSIMGYMDLWKSNETSETKKQQIQSAQNSGKYILTMLSNLLEFSRLEQHSKQLHISRFNLIELIEEVMGMFYPFAETKNLLLEFDNQLDNPFFVETDYTMLKQILSNLLSNAIKYTLEGSVQLSLQQDDTDKVIFTIIDTGIGIDEKDMPELFTPFSRIQNPLKAQGSGFGMYVTKGLTEALDGTIRINSKKDKGTCITVELPMKRITETITMDKSTPYKNTGPVSHHILIFEDHAALGTMLTEVLQQMGHQTTLCDDNANIHQYITNISNYDIVFTDMELKNITGKDILKLIRNIHPDIPVWLMTAHDDYTEEKAISEGFNGLIPKPINMKKLFTILSKKQQTPLKDNLTDQFMLLSSLFDNDEETIKEILTSFVKSTYEDTDKLEKMIKENNFEGAQQLCHKMHPFFAQLNAEHLCIVLRKMDKLRGQDESAFPEWKEALSKTLHELRLFANEINRRYLDHEKEGKEGKEGKEEKNKKS
jgi:signal transduction histidine kinase/DNA-binding NarL/FixJ family response regulator